MNKSTNLGARCNNPLNIRATGEKWKGLNAEQPCIKGFCNFVSVDYGIRAAIIVLKNYIYRHHLTNILNIVHRWAPPVENNTDAYVKNVELMTGIKANDYIDADEKLTRIVAAMAKIETGMTFDLNDIKNVRQLFHV